MGSNYRVAKLVCQGVDLVTLAESERSEARSVSGNEAKTSKAKRIEVF